MDVSNSVRRTGNRRRAFTALNGAGIGVFYIYIYSAVAGPFAQRKRLQFTRSDYLFCASVSFDRRKQRERISFFLSLQICPPYY